MWSNSFIHSEEFELIERLSVNMDTGDLEITWNATDPLYYTQPLEGNRIMVRTNMAVDSYDCTLDEGHHPELE